MATKTLGTLLIVILCIFLLPVGLGIIGGIFGIVVGVFGAVFGAIAGIFGAIFGVFGWLFDGLFGWCDMDAGFPEFNIFTIAALVLIVFLLSRNKRKQ